MSWMDEKRTAARTGPRSAERVRIAGLLLQRTGPLEFRSVLDVGCRRGELLELLLAEHPGIRACGIDLSERRIKAAAERLGGRAQVTVGDAENLPYPDASFDLLICGNPIRRCQTPARAVNQFYRVLRKDGTLILFGYGRTPAGLTLARVVARYGGESGGTCSAKEIRAILERSAFRNVEWESPIKNVYLAAGKK